MHLASDAVALGQRGGAVVLGVGAHALGEQLLGLRGAVLVLPPAGAAEHRGRDREQALGDDRVRGRRDQHRRRSATRRRARRSRPPGRIPTSVAVAITATAGKVMPTGASPPTAPPAPASTASASHVSRLGRSS